MVTTLYTQDGALIRHADGIGADPNCCFCKEECVINNNGQEDCSYHREIPCAVSLILCPERGPVSPWNFTINLEYEGGVELWTLEWDLWEGSLNGFTIQYFFERGGPITRIRIKWDQCDDVWLEQFNSNDRYMDYERQDCMYVFSPLFQFKAFADNCPCADQTSEIQLGPDIGFECVIGGEGLGAFRMPDKARMTKFGTNLSNALVDEGFFPRNICNWEARMRMLNRRGKDIKLYSYIVESVKSANCGKGKLGYKEILEVIESCQEE